MNDPREESSNASSWETTRGEEYYGSDVTSEGSLSDEKCIAVGEYLPYGLRMFYENNTTVVRMKDIGVKNRIIVIGVVGSFTPDCWNRHLFQVIKKLQYYREREVGHICCISTNDPFTHWAWGDYLGCNQAVLMWADTYKHFTKKIGMDMIVPWLDNKIRSKRYVILADDMVVTKIMVAPKDQSIQKWQCDHLVQELNEEDDDEEEEDNDNDNLWEPLKPSRSK